MQIHDYDQAKDVLSKAEKRYNHLKYQELEHNMSEFVLLFIHEHQYKKAEKILLEKIDILEKKYGKSSFYLVSEYYKTAELYLVQRDYTSSKVYILKGLAIVKQTATTSFLYANGLVLHGRMYKELDS